MAHLLDHLVLPVADLDVARARLTALGFTVAPDGIHPFGTVNCCIYLADGTFLEPLAVWDSSIAADAIRAGNVFVARDHVFRASIGEEGLSAIVLASDDADADHRRFHDAGIEIGDVLTFSRDVIDASGRKDTATFKLAFAGDPDVVDAFVFSCERINSPKIDRAALQRHANGAEAVTGVLLAEDAREFASLLGQAADLPSASGGVALGDVRISFIADDEMTPGNGTMQAVTFRIADLEATASVLAGNGVEHDMRGHRIVVPPARGQGVFFIFEASR